jgi:hypothetical protein
VSPTVTYSNPLQVISRVALFLEFIRIVSSNLYTAPRLACSKIANFSASVFALLAIAATEFEFLTAYLTSALLLSPEMILTTALCVSKESHSGSAPPQPFNKSKTENHHKANGGLFLDGFIGMLTMSYSQWGVGRAMHPVVPLRKH